MRSLFLLLGLLPGPLWLTASCVTSQHVTHFGAGTMQAVHTVPERAWQVLVDEQPAGFVVQFRSSADTGQQFFSVRNEWNQDLGMIDALGRAWRFQPHSEDAEWLGTGTVAAGAGRVLRLPGGCRLTEVGLDALLQPSSPPDTSPAELSLED